MPTRWMLYSDNVRPSYNCLPAKLPSLGGALAPLPLESLTNLSLESLTNLSLESLTNSSGVMLD
eukprot:3204126-Heterocapsa_arctica.AAC.1